MSRGRALAAVPAAETPAPADQRAALMRSLTGRGTLGGEWDAGRLLLVPRPGGRLTRTGPCPVAGCGRARPGAGPLCGWHDRQFASSGRVSVVEWIAAGEPRLTQRRRLSQLACLVTGDDGTSCPRPGIGAAGLCHAHDQAWADARRTGEVFGGFLARAEPLPGFGSCAAACCYLQASYRKSRLCVVHYRMWCEQGRPAGADFADWAAGVRQPANGRVVSLRGLPELVRLELLYAIQVRVHEQIRTGAGNIRGYVDRLRAAGVASLTDYDVAEFDADRDRDYARFARYATDRVRLAC